MAFFAGQLFKPNKVYSGQKLTILVTIKTPPNTSNIIPARLVTVWVKYNTLKTTASNKRIILSAFPMFFFITFFLNKVNTVFVNN